MRAIISDVHANLEALQAVLQDIAAQGADEIYCLGDVIDYGPNPRECIDLLMGCKVVLLGDRDQAVLFDEAGDFGTESYQSALWTRNELESLAIPGEERARRWDFLASCPRMHQEGEFLYVHGSPTDPLHGHILPEDLFNRPKMAENFACIQRYCFHGHTHVPGIITERDEYLSPLDVDFIYRLDERKTLCNVGSVGQSRDGDWRACYVVLDNDTIRFRRVEYDIARTQQKMNAIPDLADFLGPPPGLSYSERDWLTATSPSTMLRFLGRRCSPRKLRLFACACCRRIWHLLTDQRSRDGLLMMERSVEGLVSEAEMEVARLAARHAPSNHLLGQAGQSAGQAVASAVARTLRCDAVADYAAWAVGSLHPTDAQKAEKRTQADLLREIVGNPFRRVATPAVWPAAVVQLAEAHYNGADCAFALHDALLDAGCPDLATHFRSGQHPKGCWVVDLILGKS